MQMLPLLIFFFNICQNMNNLFIDFITSLMSNENQACPDVLALSVYNIGIFSYLNYPKHVSTMLFSDLIKTLYNLMY